MRRILFILWLGLTACFGQAPYVFDIASLPTSAAVSPATTDFYYEPTNQIISWTDSVNGDTSGDYPQFLAIASFATVIAVNFDVNTLLVTNLASLPALTNIIFNQCGITNLDVRGCTNLYTVSAGQSENLTNFNARGCPALHDITFTSSGGLLEFVDVTNCVDLAILYITSQSVPYLTFSNNPALTNLACQNPYPIQVTTNINLTTLTNLRTLDVSVCALTNGLDLVSNTNLTSIKAEICGLSSLKVGDLPLLESLGLANNDFTFFNTSTNTSLTSIDLGANAVLTNFVPVYSLKQITVSGTKLTNLDLTISTNLDIVTCGNGPLSNLVLTCEATLTNLTASLSDLQTLTLTGHTNLGNLDVQSCGVLTSLIVSGCTSLTSIRANNCALTVMDVTGLTLLNGLNVRVNSLSATEVDNTLCELDVNGWSGDGEVYIDSNTAPTAAGVTCAGNLTTKGWTDVVYDP